MEIQKLIERFLFGEMSEEERDNLEARFIVDTDLFEEIKACEDELLERYVRGWMDPTERRRFEKSYLTTDTRRERVEFTRQLVSVIDEQRHGATYVTKSSSQFTAENSIWEMLAALISGPKLALAGALSLIFAVIGGWVIYQSTVPQLPEIAKNDRNAETTASNIEAPTPSDPTIGKENNDPDNVSNIASDLINRTVRASPTPTTGKSTTKIPVPNAVLALIAGTARSEGRNNVLDLPKGASAAKLQLTLESVDYKIYSAKLVDADGNILFQQSNLRANRLRVDMKIPAAKLERGDYIIKLYGKNDAGENESVADFQFRVMQ